MGLPPPQFNTPLRPDQINPELSLYPIYGVTPDNKYTPISIDQLGRLNVNATFSGSITIGEIGVTDESSFLFGASLQQPVGGVYQDVSPTLLPGETGVVRLTEYRAFHTNLRDSSGNEVFPATETTALAINAGLETLNSLIPSVYDYIDLAYTGSDLTTATFKTGGSGGTVVSVLTLTYDGSGNLLTVTKS